MKRMMFLAVAVSAAVAFMLLVKAQALSVNMGTYDPVTETVTIPDFSDSATVTLKF